ncbi:hypothetical protein HK405_016026, partial [Cladochytrium tenue]
WRREIEKFTEDLSVYIYHGPNRTRSVSELRSYDVILGKERSRPEEVEADGTIKKKAVPGGTLFRTAHSIKNYRGASAQGAFELSARKRFCLTGTPIQNNVGEIYSLLRFLQLPHFRDLANFHREIGEQRPARGGRPEPNTEGIRRLRAIAQRCLLRRTKKTLDRDGKPIITLPDRQVEVVTLTFSDPESDFYTAISNNAIATFTEYNRTGQ